MVGPGKSNDASLSVVRTELLPSLLMATAARSLIQAKTGEAPGIDPWLETLSQQIAALLSLLEIGSARTVMAAAGVDVRAVLQELPSPSAMGLLTTVSSVVLILFASKKTCPPEIRLAIETVFGEILDRPETVRERVTVALKGVSVCNQLHKPAQFN